MRLKFVVISKRRCPSHSVLTEFRVRTRESARLTEDCSFFAFSSLHVLTASIVALKVLIPWIVVFD